MNLFADYVQPLTNWLQANPSWCLFITFSVSLTESLAIIGSIIPGSITMTAIGILAGSGIMRVDLTLAAAIAGAVAGDSLSYALGYFYSDRLTELWLFKKYPKWLQYGKEFFERHGGKSVLLGRFVGPLRSITPVIAGIMHMKHWRFFIANFLSAIGWSLLYIMPGVLIGAASHELSPESATRLFLLTLILLAGIWLLGLLIKWLFSKLNSFLKKNLHQFWLWLKGHPVFYRLVNTVTPQNELNHYPTVALFFSTLIFLALTLLIVLTTIQSQTFNSLNIPVQLFMQSFNTTVLKNFFIICAQFTSPLTIASLYLLCCFWFLIHRKIKSLIYLTSVVVLSGAMGYFLSAFIQSPRPQGLLVTLPGFSFPDINLMIATSFYGFILFYIDTESTEFTNTLRTCLLIILGLSGLAAIYLGDYWLTDVAGALIAGTTVCLCHCLIYRKNSHTNTKPIFSGLILLLLALMFVFVSSISVWFNFKKLTHNHTPYHKEFILSENSWWNQQKPILPLYRFNRIGNRISLINIQYTGDLDSLESSLELNGWELHTESFFTKLLMKMNTKSTGIKLPLLEELYENKSPELMMTFKVPGQQLVLVLRIWESNYHLEKLNNPIWIGSIHPHFEKKKNNLSASSSNDVAAINPLTQLLPALSQFTIRRLEISDNMIKKTTLPVAPVILLIKESTITNEQAP